MFYHCIYSNTSCLCKNISYKIFAFFFLVVNISGLKKNSWENVSLAIGDQAEIPERTVTIIRRSKCIFLWENDSEILESSASLLDIYDKIK